MYVTWPNLWNMYEAAKMKLFHDGVDVYGHFSTILRVYTSLKARAVYS